MSRASRFFALFTLPLFLSILVSGPAGAGSPCAAPDNGAGTPDFPPISNLMCPGGYDWPDGYPLLTDGFPPGATLVSGPATRLEIATRHENTDPDWWVESFFDITYRIDFAGAPGGILSGLAGSTTRTTGVNLGAPCRAPDNGMNTADFPPMSFGECPLGYRWPDGEILLMDGLPAGTDVRSGPDTWLMITTVTENQGMGGLGGSLSTFSGMLFLDLVGTGSLTGYERMIPVPVTGEIHNGPRNNGDPLQSFANQWVRLEGLILGDPDFDLLRIQGGEYFGMPSPGESLIMMGAVSTFFGTLHLDLVGTGVYGWYERVLPVPVIGEIRSDPRGAGDPIQFFGHDLVRMIGSLNGDPDLSILSITAGRQNGLPGSGQAVLTRLPSGDFAVDSFFDVTYRVDFAGAPGGPFDGIVGSDVGAPRILMGLPGTTAASQTPPALALRVPDSRVTSAGTRMLFDLPASGPMSLVVYDILGRRVSTLAEGVLPAGSHEVRWAGRSDDGQVLPSGIYWIRLKAGADFRNTRVVRLR